MSPTEPKQLEMEAIWRDQALDLLEQKRAFLIQRAKNFRDALLAQSGETTSIHVTEALKRDPICSEYMAQVDGRWMGAVFRGGQGLRRVGWRSIGSHKRPVAVWRKA